MTLSWRDREVMLVFLEGLLLLGKQHIEGVAVGDAGVRGRGPLFERMRREIRRSNRIEWSDREWARNRLRI